ncbi:cysteine synthase [Paraphoma chrysanthemicola]|uniref:Cysteine synthase n=1 Tax=Paraphoma chrysanthemicola TaxID=798071 RepID=A0A8K0R3I4_9PLEO|nr:cysteine synthase [Paraphoma chrysanthemicola]
MAFPDNVFRGSQSVAQYFDPDCNPPLPLVEIPDRLNPYRKDNVRIYAKMLTCLPAQNVKSLPALHMLRQEPKARTRKIAEASSGSTILSLGILARVLWGNEDVEAHVTNKKSVESLNMLRFFGIKPCLFAGLAQQEPTDPTGIMARLRRKAAKRDDMVYLGQYDNENNWKAHATWTGPQILRQLPEITVFSTTVGTGGCIAGTGVALKSQKPSVRVLGVFNVAGDPVPGPRYYEGFQSSPFPWQETIDTRVEVTSADAYRMSMQLSREGLICGPSSGEALKGLLQYISGLKSAGRLDELVDEKTGDISCVFTCCDLPYQYLPAYFEKLGAEEFPPIENEILLRCDQAKHDLRWILDNEQALGCLSIAHSSNPEKTVMSNVTLLSLDSSKESLNSQLEEPNIQARASGAPRSLGRFCGLLRPRKRHTRPNDPQTAHLHAQPLSGTLVVDLRSSQDYIIQNIPGSLSTPLPGLQHGFAGRDLFGDADAVHEVWTRIQRWLQSATVAIVLAQAARSQQKVLLLCYDGFASQLASSAFRERKVEAYTVRGGFPALYCKLQK